MLFCSTVTFQKVFSSSPLHAHSFRCEKKLHTIGDVRQLVEWSRCWISYLGSCWTWLVAYAGAQENWQCRRAWPVSAHLHQLMAWVPTMFHMICTMITLMLWALRWRGPVAHFSTNPWSIEGCAWICSLLLHLLWYASPLYTDPLWYTDLAPLDQTGSR
jgi:hypothetical protein